MDLLLGLDVGTTATKALLFDRQANVVAEATQEYGLLTPREGWVEQDPEELWQGVVQATREVTRALGPGDCVVALGQSSQGGTTVPVDADFRPTRDAISWMDGRATAQVQQAKETLGADVVYRTTGWHLYQGLPLQQLAWLRQNEPDTFAVTERFLFVSDLVNYRLSGELAMDPSNASITQLLNVASGDWDDTLLDYVGVRREQLSPVYPSGAVIGRLTAEASALTGLPQGLPIVNGAHDQYCAAVGLGVTAPGQVMLSCGTAWIVLAVPQTLNVGLESGLDISCHAVDSLWGAIISLGGVGTSLEWLLDTVWWRKDGGRGWDAGYDAINEAVARSPAGARRLLFYPLAGGHAYGEGGHGGFHGLSLSHSRDDMARAVMEGVALELRWALTRMQDAGWELRELTMVGGAAGSSVWPQIVADVTGIPVALPDVRQAASLGAAGLAGVGIGWFDTPAVVFPERQGGQQRLTPAPERHDLYARAFDRYRRVFTVSVDGEPGGDRA